MAIISGSFNSLCAFITTGLLPDYLKCKLKLSVKRRAVVFQSPYSSLKKNNMNLLRSSLIILSSLLAQPITATSTTEFNFKQFGWTGSITLNGYTPSETIYLPITEHLNVQKAVLHLKMAFSPILTKGTRVEVRFNQTLIRSLPLPEKLNQESSWDIELPLTQLSADWQALTFSAYLVSESSLCDPNNWIYISPESTITINSLPFPFNGTLNQLPYPFIDSAALNPVPTLLLLPASPSQQEIFSLFEVALRLGQLAGDNKVNLSVDYTTDATEKKNANIIFIGKSALVPRELLGHVDEMNQQAGIISLNRSPYNPLYGALTITGYDHSALDKAVSAFLTPEFKSLASGHFALIEKIDTKPLTQTMSSLYRTTFKDLGYTDQSVSGIGRHQLTFNIPLPNDRDPNYAKVKTLITTPLFPGKHESQITLLVNGKKQSSFWLNDEHSAWETELTPEALKPGNNRLDYLIDLHLEHEECTYREYNEAWATIYAESQFQASFFQTTPLAMLTQLPVPFSEEISVIVPPHLSKEELNKLANLFFKFGQLFRPNPAHFTFRTSNEMDESFIRNHNVILIGTPDSNPWIHFALDYMPVQLIKESRLLKTPQKTIELTGEQGTGLLELMPSPWSERNTLFLITGSNEQALFSAFNAFINDKRRSKLNGNIALINADQSINVLSSYDNRYISFKQRINISLSNLGKNLRYYVESSPQILIYLLVVIVPLVILLRRRRKK